MLSIGRARHPGPGTSSYPPGFSIEFLNVGGWLSRGDLALESSAHFLAVAEHRLVPARARTVTTQLRQARRSSVWAPSCQDVTPGGHAGVGVISLHGAPLSLPTLLNSSFEEFFRIGRAMRVILPLGNGGVVQLFVIYGYQGAENDPEKLQFTEHLFAAVLAEARMCCAGQPVILAGGVCGVWKTFLFLALLSPSFPLLPLALTPCLDSKLLRMTGTTSTCFIHVDVVPVHTGTF